MLELLVYFMPFKPEQEFRVMDMGCGTGNVTLMIKKKYPNAVVTCLDMAVNMLEEAKQKLKDYSDIRYVVADFSDYEFDARFDAIVSSLTFHHLDEGDKRRLYERIFNALEFDGIFITGDVVLASSDLVQELSMERWKQHMRDCITEEEVGEAVERYYEEDRPCKLMDELSWLEKTGFSDVDVYWKYGSLALYGATKK